MRTTTNAADVAPDPVFTKSALPLPCRVEDPALWFAERTTDVERAKRLCQGCPLREPCLVGALERREPWGVWGGEVFERGVVLAHKRGRGRPRKVPLAA